MKKLISLLLAATIIITQAIALELNITDGVGTFARDSEIKLADGTELHINTLKHITEGQNEERYIEYTPGSQVIPVVSYGSVLYGMSTINYVSDYNKSKGKTVVAGVNGDFFMLDTGIPIGIVVTDGILRSSDNGANAVGFFPDGSAIIGKPSLSVNLTTDTGYSLKLDYVNKTRRNYGVYLLTPDFSANTRTSTEGTTIVLKNVSGNLKIGESVTATVDSVIKGTAPVEITEGMMVLTATEENGLAARLEGVAASSQVTISISAPDERWKQVVSAVGAGDVLLQSGQLATGLGTGAAPRTAFGVTAEGKLVFYTVDGRQSGYSNGMTLTALAKRMQSLGCTDAVNLDGGGSTVMVSQFPGNSTLETINRPSDGKQRKGANYILFINQAEKTGVPANMHLYPYDPVVLAGTSVKFEAKATDQGYYPVQAPSNLRFATDKTLGTIDQTGAFTAGAAEGELRVTVSGSGMQGSTPVTIIKTPTSISINNASSGAVVKSLAVDPLQTVDLNASCSFNGVNVISSDSSYGWSIVNEAAEIGSIDQNGVFTASGILGSRGKIVVTAGEMKAEINVSVGVSDSLIDSFEDSTGLTSGSEAINASIQSVSGYVRYGKGSAKISYDFNLVEDAAVMLPVSWKIPQNSRYLRLWVYGDNSGNLLGLKLQGSATYLPVCKLDFEGYSAVTVQLPENTTGISDLYIRKESDVLSGSIYLDHMTVSYLPDMDVTTPSIEIAAIDTESRQGFVTVRAKITDNGPVPVPKNQISLRLDGKEAPFAYSQASAEITAELPIANDGVLHRITIKAADASGNISTISYDVDPNGASEQLFADTKGHWSEKYAVYLNMLGVINGTVRKDGRYFMPDDMMTRAEFAVMMAKFLGLNASDYTGLVLPYADIDQIPSWAMEYVAAMYANGVITGKANGGSIIYDPDAPITRAEVMTVLGRTLPKGFSSGEITFKDSADIPDFAKDYVGTLVGMNVLTGYSDGTIRPNNNVQRGEAVKMLYGMY